MNIQIPSIPTTNQDLALVVQSLLDVIAALNAPQTEISLSPLYVEPAKKQEGLIVYADGTSWNPGAGKGVYLYNGTSWNKL